MSVSKSNIPDPIGAVLQQSTAISILTADTLKGVFAVLGIIVDSIGLIMEENLWAQSCWGISLASLLYPTYKFCQPAWSGQKLKNSLRDSTKLIGRNEDATSHLKRIREILTEMELDPRSHREILANFWGYINDTTGWCECYNIHGNRIYLQEGKNRIPFDHEKMLQYIYGTSIKSYFSGFVHVPSYLACTQYLDQIPEPTEGEVLETLFREDPALFKNSGATKYRYIARNSSGLYEGFFERFGTGVNFYHINGGVHDFTRYFLDIQQKNPQYTDEQIYAEIVSVYHSNGYDVQGSLAVLNQRMIPVGSIVHGKNGGLFFLGEDEAYSDIKKKYTDIKKRLSESRGIYEGDIHHPKGWNPLYTDKNIKHVTLDHLYAAMILESRRLLHTAPDIVQRAWADFRYKDANLSHNL